MTIAIADLPVVDDLNVPVDPDEYQDQTGPVPVKPGNYRFVPTKFSVRTDRNDPNKIALAEGKYPTVVIEQAKIVEPAENERQVGLFSDIRFKPFVRKSPSGDKVASDLYDFIRACDETQPIDDYEHAKALLDQHLQQGSAYYAQVGWTGYDKDYVEAEFAKVEGGKAAASKDVANAIYAKARLATKHFVQNGVLVPSTIGPSGNTIEARLKITRYFPSGTELGKGKDARGRDRIELGPFKK